MSTSSPGLKYIKELDALRAIAIISVLCNHWFKVGGTAYIISSNISAPDIFFTLSGFLITKILLGERKKAEALQLSKVQVFKNFFIKRALRTMPAYFLAIILTYLISGQPKEQFYSYLFFYTNFHQYLTDSWGPMAHLWTMAVEQQFYLVWPWIILYIPQRFLLVTILSFIGTALLCQHIIPLNEFSLVLPYTCFDALGIGGLLAWFYDKRKHALPVVYKTLKWLSLVVILIMVAQSFFYFPLILFIRTTVAIITATIILYFILYGNKKNKSAKTLFENSTLLLIGRISYGIYLYHLMLFSYDYKWYSPALKHLPFTLSSTTRFTIYIIINALFLFFTAFVSWKYFEQPISELKKYFKTAPKKEIPHLAYKETSN